MNTLLQKDSVTAFQSEISSFGKLLGENDIYTTSLKKLSILFEQMELNLQTFSSKIILDEQVFVKENSPNSFPNCLDDKYLPSFRLALLSDDFTYLSLKPECLVLALDAHSWQQQLEEFKPQLVLVESAWAGKNASWEKKLSSCHPDIQKLAAFCKKNNISTAFWNKEDPIHYDTFLATASLFDVVFTTDSTCIPKYKVELGHKNVFLLPFACQPKVHNPILYSPRKKEVSFAGAYYPRYPERCNDFEKIIFGLHNWLPITIFDRNSGVAHSPYAFPEKFKPFIKDSVPYESISTIYKGYEYSLNFNSVKSSPTMFARRVPELLASGTQVLSNESAALRRFFGDLISISDDPKCLIKQINDSSSKQAELQQLAIRKVLVEHSWQQRLSYVVKQINGAEYNAVLPIVVLAQVKNLNQVTWLLDCFVEQAHKKAILLLVKDDNLDVQLDIPKNVFFISRSKATETTLGSFCLANSWVSLWHPADYYGPAYLSDMQQCCTFAPGDVIARNAFAKNNDGKIAFVGKARAYTTQGYFVWRSALVASSSINMKLSLIELVKQIDEPQISNMVLNIPPYEYVKDATLTDKPKSFWKKQVALSELEVNCGVPIDKILAEANAQSAAKLIKPNPLPIISVTDLAKFLTPNVKRDLCKLEQATNCVTISSDLPSDKHEYWFCEKLLLPEQLNFKSSKTISARLDSLGVLDLWLVFIFKNEDGETISHQMQGARRYAQVSLPDGVKKIQLALRWVGSGKATINKIDLARPEYLF